VGLIYIIQYPPTRAHNNAKQQGNRRLHFARAVHSRHTLPAIGDAANRQHAGAGPSHGHRQHAQKFGKDRARISRDIHPCTFVCLVLLLCTECMFCHIS